MPQVESPTALATGLARCHYSTGSGRQQPGGHLLKSQGLPVADEVLACRGMGPQGRMQVAPTALSGTRRKACQSKETEEE